MKRGKRAFTILEVLLSLAIAGMVMVACVSLLFAMVKLIDDMEDSEPLENHANTVERFLRSAFLNSTFSQTMPEYVVGAVRAGSGAVRLGQNPEIENGEVLHLCFGVARDHPLFLSRNQFSQEKICWLEFREGSGLYLVWTFIAYEEDETDYIVYENLISEYVESVSYLFYSEDRDWEEEKELNLTGENAGQMPLFLCLNFSDGQLSYKRIIPLFSFLESGTSGSNTGIRQGSGVGGGQNNMRGGR